MFVRRCAPTLFAALSLAGCNAQSPGAITPAATTGKAMPVAGMVKACPSRDFDAFLAAFMASEEMQKAFTDAPLRSDSIDSDAEPEPKTVTTMVSPEEMALPIIPRSQELIEQGLARSSRREGGGMVVILAKPDSDYQVSYYFRLDDTCWHLYRKYDESI